ncbi:MAG: HPr family phosphocarrier protein [Eubacteriaceae bacterium]|nr:HPr family phosphocarrier protein [Eubacteriaceae bacterium]
MVQQKTCVKVEGGLHGKIASTLVELASKCKSDIHIQKENATVNAKSIIGVMILNVKENDEVLVQIDGIDEAKAMNNIVSLLEGKPV